MYIYTHYKICIHTTFGREKIEAEGRMRPGQGGVRGWTSNAGRHSTAYGTSQSGHHQQQELGVVWMKMIQDKLVPHYR